MAGIKIVDLPALGRDLIATDLLELSLAGGTGSRKITGQEIINASKLNVGTTPIINGAVGQVLFQGTGNVLQESANLFWDNTNGRLGIGTSSPLRAFEVYAFNPEIATRLSSSGIGKFSILNNSGTEVGSFSLRGQTGETRLFASTSYFLTFFSNGVESMRIPTTGNVLINTTTDAGYKLDVNGAARVTNGLVINAGQRLSLGGSDYGSDALYCVGGNPLDVKAYYYTRFTKTNNTLGVQVIQVDGQALIKGSGNTSSTTSLLVQQSTGVNVLSVRDDMYVTVQNTNNTECFQVRGANDDATIRFTPSGGTSNIVLKSQSSSITLSTTANSFGDLRVNSSGQTLRIGTSSLSGGGVNYYSSQNGTIHSHRWFHNNVEQMSLQYTGNFLINTTTDAGFRLDVNGTGRVSTSLATPIWAWSGTNVSQRIQTTQVGSVNRALINIENGQGGLNYSTDGFVNSILAINNSLILQNQGMASCFTINPTYNFNANVTSGAIMRGIYYNPTLTNIGTAQHFAFHSTSGRVRFEGLPTSPTGLNAGDIYNDGGTLKIV